MMPGMCSLFDPDPVAAPDGPIPAYAPGQTIAEHPSRLHFAPRWRFWVTSYRGGPEYGEAVDSRGAACFVQHEREGADGPWAELALSRRKQLSVYKNYCRPIMDRFNDFVFRNEHITRGEPDESGEQWRRFRDDADTRGTPIGHFMARAMLEAQLFGRSFVRLRTRIPAGVIPETVAQADAAGVRIFVDSVSPFAVIDWRRDSGRLTEAIVQYTPTTVVHWRGNEFTEYRIDGLKVLGVLGTGASSFGGLPLIELLPFAGESQIKDIAELNKQLFNLDSLLRAELYERTFTQFVITGVTASQINNVTLGAHTILCVPQKDAGIQCLGAADVSQAESIRTAIADDIREIYRLAGLRSGDPLETGKPQSGIARSWEFRDVEAWLGAIADEAERAENIIAGEWARSRGLKPEQAPAVSYPDRFDVQDLAAELAATLDMIDSPGFPPARKVKQLGKFIDLSFPDTTTAERTGILDDSRKWFEEQSSTSAMLASIQEQRDLLRGRDGSNGDDSSIGNGDGSQQ